jgi:hypothetical protein
MWLDGSILRPYDPGFATTWPSARLSLAPIGFVPSSVVPGGLAPVCPPGFSFLLAGAERLAGTRGVFAAVPLCVGIAVWCGFVLGRRMAGSMAGLFGALLLLASPVFLFQALQPMSDVPAAACWLAALAVAAGESRASVVLAGLCSALAILIRPNLAPLAAPVLLVIGAAAPERASWRSMLLRGLAFSVAVLPGIAAVALLHTLVYGAPWRSGYGRTGTLFDLAHVPTNLARYSAWLLQTQTPWVLVGLLAPLALPARATWWPARERGAQPRLLATACVLTIAVCLLLYLPYVPFDNWSYLRFLLVAIVLLILTSAAVTARALSHLPRVVGVAAGLALLVALGSYGLKAARQQDVLGIRQSEARFVESATWARDHLPENAVVVTVFHSGAVRYHGGRPSVLWDALPPGALDAFLAELVRLGRRPYLLFESWEVPRFRERFSGSSPVGRLDWPPRAQIGREISVYDPADRARYFSGESVATERVWTASERRWQRRRLGSGL